MEVTLLCDKEPKDVKGLIEAFNILKSDVDYLGRLIKFQDQRIRDLESAVIDLRRENALPQS